MNSQKTNLNILLDGYPLFTVILKNDTKLIIDKIKEEWYNKNRDKLNNIIKHVTISLFNTDKFKVGLSKHMNKICVGKDDDKNNIVEINCFLYSIKNNDEIIDRTILEEISKHCYKYLDELNL